MAPGRESSASRSGHPPYPDGREVKAVTPMSYLLQSCYLMLYFVLETARVHKGREGHGLVGWCHYWLVPMGSLEHQWDGVRLLPSVLASFSRCEVR